MRRVLERIYGRVGPGTARSARERPYERRAGHVRELAQSAGFERLRDEIVPRTRPAEADRVLDLGAGTGLLSIAVAPKVEHVTAIDSSPAVCRLLEADAREHEVVNIDVVIADARTLPLPACSIDLALSNYCLHHINDSDKLVPLGELARVLQPGGRLVLCDMMFNVGLRNARDRRVVVHLALAMLSCHPAGLLRLLRNVTKTIFGPTEHPASVDWWEQALADSGFCDVYVTPLEHEGGITCARRAP